jgi:acetyltransferase-like isoleucine patch superfamily enzyme
MSFEPHDMSFLSREELESVGFASIGANVKLSRRASIYSPARISLGDGARIDDFCVLSAGQGGISIGRNVHIAVFASIIGAGRVEIGDFSGLSSRVSLYSSTDDYSGIAMTNPTVPGQYRKVINEDVVLGRHVIVASGSVILPGVTLGDGVAIGALSLVNSSCPEFGIYVGAPARFVRERRRDLLAVEQRWADSMELKSQDQA